MQRAKALVRQRQRRLHLRGVGHIGGQGQHLGALGLQGQQLQQLLAQGARLPVIGGQRLPLAARRQRRAAQQHQAGLPVRGQMPGQRQAHAAQAARDQVHALPAQARRRGVLPLQGLIGLAPAVGTAQGDGRVGRANPMRRAGFVQQLARQPGLHCGRTRLHHIDETAVDGRAFLPYRLAQRKDGGHLGVQRFRSGHIFRTACGHQQQPPCARASSAVRTGLQRLREGQHAVKAALQRRRGGRVHGPQVVDGAHGAELRLHRIEQVLAIAALAGAHGMPARGQAGGAAPASTQTTSVPCARNACTRASAVALPSPNTRATWAAAAAVPTANCRGLRCQAAA